MNGSRKAVSALTLAAWFLLALAPAVSAFCLADEGCEMSRTRAAGHCEAMKAAPMACCAPAEEPPAEQTAKNPRELDVLASFQSQGSAAPSLEEFPCAAPAEAPPPGPPLYRLFATLLT